MPYKIQREDRALVDEFRKTPIGKHSPDLQRVLNALRGLPHDRHVLVCRKPYREWVLARLTGRRGELPEIFEDEVFTDLAEAEWALFKRRWKTHTGEDLN